MYVKDLDDSFGTLIIAMYAGGWTPLGLPGTNRFTTTDVVVIRGGQTSVRPEHPGLVLDFQNELRIEDSARLVVDGASLVLAVPPLVRNGGRLEVTGPWTLNVPLAPASNGFVTVNGALTSTVPFTLDGGTLSADRLVDTRQRNGQKRSFFCRQRDDSRRVGFDF